MSEGIRYIIKDLVKTKWMILGRPLFTPLSRKSVYTSRMALSFLCWLEPSGWRKVDHSPLVSGLEKKYNIGTISIGFRVVNELEPKRSRDSDGDSQNNIRAVSAYELIQQHAFWPAIGKEEEVSSTKSSDYIEGPCLDHMLSVKPSRSVRPVSANALLSVAHCGSSNVFLFDEPLSNLDARCACRCARKSSDCT